MNVTSAALSLTVDDPLTSAEFLAEHLGFVDAVPPDAEAGFASMRRDDVGVSVVLLRRGMSTLPADQRDVHATGLILAFVVDDLEGELARLESEGVEITMPLTVEEWGERAFQVRDPNGVVLQLVDWKG